MSATPAAAETVHPAAVIVLAAGEGTRMKSATPKVLHTLCGRPMLGHVVAAARDLAPERLVVVVGHGREQAAAYLAGFDPAARPVVQEVQNGTGHAVRVALDALVQTDGELDGTVLVVFGDTPLLTAATMARLTAEHQRSGNAVTVLTTKVADPTGYGRILRGPGGEVLGTVEQRDATEEQRAITEINSGVQAYDAKLLRFGLSQLTTANAQGEEYLTDVLGILAAAGHPVGAYLTPDHDEVTGVNDRVQLAQLRRVMNARLTEHWMREGVSIIDPATTWIDVQVRLERDAVLHPNTQLHGQTVIGEGAEIGPNCTLTDTLVGPRAWVSNATTKGAEIGEQASVGPYTYLREGTKLGRKAKAGGFVEMKKAVVGDDSKVPHLSYVGDAQIGVGCNIGAGVITANYDGVNKFRTEIGDYVFVGTDSVLVAPAQLADGSYVAAGSAVVQPVPPGALAVGRARQRNIEGYVERKRPDGPAAAAARAARAAAAQPGPASDSARPDPV
ncbi:MAG TPA: bifunctional UDP-N-acetylglucosamine diphosphorylase/glucosamine-1-phosphate N-acetyltransferase GlmU [Actinocrinis sp.]|nr:bifunctional UDP-N-acetylglucosamine diphosphorylase/glucosamine-1-phosphate N-acetyltransferase GlmU [Actinocrinis sp.]